MITYRAYTDNLVFRSHLSLAHTKLYKKMWPKHKNVVALWGISRYISVARHNILVALGSRAGDIASPDYVYVSKSYLM